MKVKIALLFCTFMVLATSAQSMRSRTGINALDQQRDMQGAPKPPTPEEQLEKTMAKMTTDLELNGLQEAAIRNILKEQMVQLTALRQENRPDSEKMDEARLISEKSDKQILALLDPGQIDKYNALKEEFRSGKKKKKKDRKKDQEEVHE